MEKIPDGMDWKEVFDERERDEAIKRMNLLHPPGKEWLEKLLGCAPRSRTDAGPVNSYYSARIPKFPPNPQGWRDTPYGWVCDPSWVTTSDHLRPLSKRLLLKAILRTL